MREYDGDQKVVWEFPVPLFGHERADGHYLRHLAIRRFVIRLKNGNTLIGAGNGHALLEVSPAKKIVWEVHQKDLVDITLAWVTNTTALPNGNIVFGNCHVGSVSRRL